MLNTIANRLKLEGKSIQTERLPYKCRFIISTHLPFMLGTLNGRIYNIDTEDLDEVNWTELENMRYFYSFFDQHKKEFNKNI